MGNICSLCDILSLYFFSIFLIPFRLLNYKCNARHAFHAHRHNNRDPYIYIYICWNLFFVIWLFGVFSIRIYLMSCGFDCCVFFLHFSVKLFFDSCVFFFLNIKFFVNISHLYSFICIVSKRNALPNIRMQDLNETREKERERNTRTHIENKAIRLIKWHGFGNKASFC